MWAQTIQIAAGVKYIGTVEAEKQSHFLLQTELAVFIAWEVGLASAQNFPFDIWGWVESILPDEFG